MEKNKIGRLPCENDIGITSAVHKAFGCLGDGPDGDLISRRALIRDALRMEGDLHLPSGRIKHVIGIPIDYIRDAPTIDLKDMLHTGQCGTCKHSVSLSNDPNYPHIFCDQHDVYMTQDDFCSRYEPKEA